MTIFIAEQYLPTQTWKAGKGWVKNWEFPQMRWSMLPMAKPIHWLPQKFSVYLLLMECKMITYTKSPVHSLAKWWLWSSPEQSFQVELKDITEGDATRIMQSKYWLKPKLGGNVRTLFKYSDIHCQILPEILTLS